MFKSPKFWTVIYIIGVAIFMYLFAKTINDSAPIKQKIAVSSTPNRQVVFANSAFTFNYQKHAKLLFATGIWKFDDERFLNIPHSVRIDCLSHFGTCKKTVISINTINDKDFIDVDIVDFKIIKWNEQQIIAQYIWVFGKGSQSTLIVDLKDKSIRVTSSKETPLKQSKIGHYTDNGVLIDGSDKAISIGDNRLAWGN